MRRSFEDPPDEGPPLDEDVMCDCGKNYVMENWYCCPQCGQEQHAVARAEEQRDDLLEGRYYD